MRINKRGPALSDLLLKVVVSLYPLPDYSHTDIMYAQVRKQELALRKRLQQLRLLYSTDNAIIDDHHQSPQTDRSKSHLSDPTSPRSISQTATLASPFIDPTDGIELHSPHDSLIFERQVQAPHSRSQSVSSLSSIPAHLSQEAYVPSVIDATCELDCDAPSIEVICGHSGHPLCRKRTTSMSGLSFMALLEQNEDEKEDGDSGEDDTVGGLHLVNNNPFRVAEINQSPADVDVDLSDHTRLNFTSYNDLLSDEEECMVSSPTSTRKNSVVIVPLSLRSTLNSTSDA